MLKSSILLFFIIATESICWAGPVTSASLSKIGYKIEPLLGYEQVFRNTPTPHTSSRMTYGARLIVGQDKLSAEAEYTKAEDTENYLVAPQKITNKDDQFKLGVRSSMNLNAMFFVTARAGGQATKNINETTTNGVLVSTENSVSYNPYAGMQVGIHIGKNFSIAAGSNVIFKDLSDLTKNNYQTTLSVSLGTE
jgi:hypothetical protein